MERANTATAPSPPIRFLLSVLGLAVVVCAVLARYWLLAEAYGATTGGGSSIGPLTAAETATLLIILVELSMGLFLTEARGITNLGLCRIFPDELRGRLFWITLLIIVTLALTGAGLIYLDDFILANDTALGTDGSAVFLPMPMWARLGLTFVLPFVIALWAVPFEALLRVFRAPRI